MISRESAHGFSQAIAGYLSKTSRENSNQQRNGNEARVRDVRTVSGFGLEAILKKTGDTSDETNVWLGSQRFLEAHNCELSLALQQTIDSARIEGRSTVLLGWDGVVRGVFTLKEDVRKEAATTVETCRELGLDLGILSGDLAVHAKRLGDALRFPASGELLPEDKLSTLNTVQRSIGPVLMVGDGINNCPAMAGADVAASLGSGADLSRDAGGVCLLQDDLSCVPWMIGLARRTRRVTRQNLFWAFGYNTVGMALAATGTLNPVIAAAVMFGSSAFVLWNSRRLSGFDLPGGQEHNRVASSRIMIDQSLDSVGEVVNA